MFGLTTETKIVKKSKRSTEDVETPSLTQDDIVDITRRIVTGSGQVVVQVFASYMLCDTIRKVVIHKLTK